MATVSLERLEQLAQRIITTTEDGNSKLVTGDLAEDEVQDALHTVLDAILDLTMVLNNAGCTLAKVDAE